MTARLDHEQGHRSREIRTRMAVGLATLAMVVELAAGQVSGSLALLADGWHRAGDVGFLALSALAYWFARTRARSARFAFGTGKVEFLAGFTNGVILTVVALGVLAESVERLLSPGAVAPNGALAACGFGLVVSIINVLLLSGAAHHHAPGEEHDHHSAGHHDHGVDDHNHRAVYLHLLSDVLTNVLTIGALLLIRRGFPVWLDAVVAIGASFVILRWGLRLCRDTGQLLLDAVDDARATSAIRAQLEDVGAEVRDLRVWDVGGRRYGCLVVVSARAPRSSAFYRELVQRAAPVEHLAVEVVPMATEESVAPEPLPVRDRVSA